MASYRLSKIADKDLGNIASYTIQHFGIRQANLYRDGLFKALDMISDFPLNWQRPKSNQKVYPSACT